MISAMSAALTSLRQKPTSGQPLETSPTGSIQIRCRCNVTEGWARDVTQHIAQLVLELCRQEDDFSQPAREFVERILNIFTIPDEVKAIDARRWPEQRRASRDFHLCGRPRPSSIPESRPHRSGLSSLPRWQPGFLGRVPRWHGKSRSHSVRRLFLY